MRLSSKIIGWIWLWLALLFPSIIAITCNNDEAAYILLPIAMLITIPLYIISVFFISESRWARWWLMSISLSFLLFYIFDLAAYIIVYKYNYTVKEFLDPSNIISLFFIFLASWFLFFDRPKKISIKNKEEVNKVPGKLSTKVAWIWIVGSIIITLIAIGINMVVSKENKFLSSVCFPNLAILLVISYVFAILIIKKNPIGWWGFIICSYFNINIYAIQDIYFIQCTFSFSDLFHTPLLPMFLLSIATLILLLIDNSKGWKIVLTNEDLEEREKI